MRMTNTTAVLHQASAAKPLPQHHPYRLSGESAACDWVQHVELDAARRMADEDAGEPLKVLVLYGSLRQRSYSKLLAYEFSR
jgi:arsenical resistance protein ArsH